MNWSLPNSISNCIIDCIGGKRELKDDTIDALTFATFEFKLVNLQVIYDPFLVHGMWIMAS